MIVYPINIKYFTYFEHNKKIKDFQLNIEKICRELNLRESGKTEANLHKWANNEPKGKRINDKLEFDKLFKTEKCSA